nr:DUF2283 domain-containing protein [Desulfonatronum thioautotrophicum]
MSILPAVKLTPDNTFWTTYDDEADVLYVNFKKPSHADDSELTEDDVIIRYEKGDIVGLTFLNASRRSLS